MKITEVLIKQISISEDPEYERVKEIVHSSVEKGENRKSIHKILKNFFSKEKNEKSIL